MFIGIHVKHPLFLFDFSKNLNCLDRISKKKKYTNIKFCENPSSGSRVVPCGRTDRLTGRQTDRHDVTKLNSRFSQCCEKRLRKTVQFFLWASEDILRRKLQANLRTTVLKKNNTGRLCLTLFFGPRTSIGELRSTLNPRVAYPTG